MHLEIKNTFTLTEVAAWWGAVVATSVFIWDIIKWFRTGPRIFFSASTNMLAVGDPVLEDNTYIVVKVVNVGTQQTTLTNLGMYFYKNKWNKLRNYAEKSMVIANPNISFPIPYLLEPGKLWNGFILQSEKVEDMLQNGILEVVLYCSHKKKPVKLKLKQLTNLLDGPVTKRGEHEI